MSKLFQLACLLFVASATSGCGAMFASAGVESRPGDYHVNGYTSSPEAYAAVASHNYVQEYNAETYRRAVESGRAYPYMGGMTGDYWMYYRGVVPQQPMPVAPPPAATSTTAPDPRSSVAPNPQGTALTEAREARRRADTALRILREQAASEDQQQPTP